MSRFDQREDEEWCEGSTDCVCDLIAKGRAAERSNLSTAWWSQEWHAGYRQGYDDAKAKNER